LNSVHISTGEKPNSDPTERSNSPDHQQRHRQGDEAELDREGQRVGDVLFGEKVMIDRPESEQFQGEQDEGAEFRPCDGPHEEGAIFQRSSPGWG
jgi:hypothetical protein